MLAAPSIDRGGIGVHDFQCLPVHFLLYRPLLFACQLLFSIILLLQGRDSGLGAVETHQRGQIRRRRTMDRKTVTGAGTLA